MRRGTFVLILSFVGSVGCSGTRWALDDKVYARRYGTEKEDDNVIKTAKAIIDARHVAGNGGITIGGQMRLHPDGYGGEFGAFYYPESWLSMYGDISLLGGKFADDFFTGFNLGVRVQPPTRLAPFAGLGVFTGYSRHSVSATDNGVDDGDDGFVDDASEERDDYGWLSAVYPEFGLHFWLNSRTCLTGFARYYVTTQGRDHDAWFFGFGLSWLLGD